MQWFCRDLVLARCPMINCCPGPFCNDFHFQLYIELFVITLITDLPLQPRFFEADVLALYFRRAPTPPFGLPPCLQLCDWFPCKGTQLYWIAKS
jgi:hypothetical protein